MRRAKAEAASALAAVRDKPRRVDLRPTLSLVMALSFDMVKPIPLGLLASLTSREVEAL